MTNDMTTKMLEESLNKIVLLRLKGNRSIRGALKGYDLHLNILLQEAEDISDPEGVQKLGTIIVRGDNLILLSPASG